MSSISKRFSTIIRQNPSSTSPQKEPAKDSIDAPAPAAPVDKTDAAPAATTNGTTAAEPAKDAAAKPGADNGANATATPAKKETTTPAPAAKKDTKKDKDSKENAGKTSTIKRFSSMLRSRGQNGKASKAKTEATAAAAAAAKIPKKGAAKGKRVIVVTGASKGIGLEFVKQFAKQPDTFVIALSRTADKASSLRPVVSAAAKEGHHNVRALKLDITSTRSVNSVVKDIVELTDGRIDLIVNAAGSKGDPALKVWEIKGSELEEELRNNLVGPIAFTNALLPYLKPFVKEEKKEETKEETKEEKKEEKGEAKEEKAEEKAGDKTEVKDETAAATDAQPEAAAAATSEAPAAEAAPEPAPELVAPEPNHLPSHPFIVFLAPSDPIHNVDGHIHSGRSWSVAPRTLFSISRAALQVAIGKYASGLAGQGVGVVAVERHGHHDPHSSVTDEQAAAAVLNLLPDLSLHNNGKLLQASA